MSFGDFNRINTNLSSLDAQFSLNRVNRELGESQLRLSTGLQINKAEDDAAGFSIASKLGARIAGLEQGLQNAGDAKSVLDIAEASFDSMIDILTEIKVKATQAANDTYGDEERGFIQQQIDSLLDELDAIVDQTVFQEINLLDGDYEASFQVGERTADVLFVELNQGGEGFYHDDMNLDAIDVSTHDDAQVAMTAIDDALTAIAEVTNDIGIYQTQLSIREEILTQAINSNEAAQSRIQDADFAQEQSNLVKNQILQQTATSSLAQANQAPEAVLGFLG